MKSSFAEPEIVTRNGKPVSVILPIKAYNELLERLEDAEDVAYLKRLASSHCITVHWKTFLPTLLKVVMYRVVLERVAEKDLRKLSSEIQIRAISAIKGLAENPRPVGSKKLSGGKNDWRIRIGDYRIIYEIADEIHIVRINRLRHRHEVYRD